MVYSLSGKRIWLAGHNGMVGQALSRVLSNENCEIITCPKEKLDLRRQEEVESWILNNKPHAIIISAAKVGGIKANDNQPAQFLYDNLMIESNIINSAKINKVEKLMMLGSSCIYPKYAAQPISEPDMLGGPLEVTNQWYAIAKISGVMLCDAYRKEYGNDFISVMPTNLYGPGDLFNEENSHVIPALIMKFHKAKEKNAQRVILWGSGKPRREFLHSDDAAEGMVYALKNYSDYQPINIGSGKDITINHLAKIISDIVEYKGEIFFDKSMPDGTPRKLINSEKISELGWKPKINLRDGINRLYDWFKSEYSLGRVRI